MTDPDDAPRPALPPHMDPRRARGGLPPRPPRSAARRPPTGSRKVAAASTSSAPAAGPRTGRMARALSWIAVLTSFAVLVTAGAGWAMLRFYDDKITRISGLELDEEERPADLPRDATNILIVGSDSRGDLAPGQGTQGRGEDFVTGQRSDTVILAHLYGDADQAQLISFPRDAWVQIPSYVSPETGDVVPAHEGKLNSAFFEGGPALLIDTIEDLTGVYVDHYMQIDFDGFQAVVNQLDGVEVCLPEAAKEKDSGIDLPAGRQVIQGEQALAFVRQRKGLPNGDIDRIRRQQQFIGAIVRKVLSAGTLLNPVKLNGVITVATSALQVDEDLTIGQLQELAFRLRGFDAGGVTFTTVPVADVNGVRQGQSVVLLDEEKADELFDSIRLDVPPAPPEAAPPPPDADEALIVAPASIRVKVLNGAGISGLGRRAADELEGVGFQIVGAPENRGTSQQGTVVLHGPDRADSARTLAAAIPGATTELDPNLTRTLEVVVGASYDGVQAVTVTGAPAEQPPAASAPPVVSAASDPCAV